MRKMYGAKWTEVHETVLFERGIKLSMPKLIHGESRRIGWKPLRVRLNTYDEDNERVRKRSDAPFSVTEAPVFRNSAVEVVGSMLESNGELLPLECQDAQLVLFNAWVIDALDREASVFRERRNGRGQYVAQYAFRHDKLRDVHAFKLPGSKISSVLYSEEFVERWQAAGLVGLEFHQLPD